MSYSRSWCVIAVSKFQEIGVDIEYIDPQINLDFSPEWKIFCKNPKVFYYQWTRQEAYLKKIGLGLNSRKAFTQEIQNNKNIYTFLYKNLFISFAVN